MVAEVARKAHNLEVGGSIPSLATKKNLQMFDKLKNLTYICRTIKKTFFEIKILSV